MRLTGKTISDQLRSALCSCGQSTYYVSQETGIDQGTLSKFKKGSVGLGLANVDKLAAFLRLRLIETT